MNRRAILIAVVVAGGIGFLALAYWLASPLFRTDAVSEEFPVAEEVPVTEEVPVVIEDGELVVPSLDEIEAMSDEEKAAVQEAVDAAAADMPDKEMVEDMPEDMGADPVIVSQGTFIGADDFHQGSGTATIYQLEDGSHVLRLENFEVTNGPDLHVFVGGHPAPVSHADVMTEPSAELGKLKGNVGDQNYEIPPDIDVTAIHSITIYCVPFQVVFASASVAP